MYVPVQRVQQNSLMALYMYMGLTSKLYCYMFISKVTPVLKLQLIFYNWMKFYVIWSNNHKVMSIFSLHIRKPLHPSFVLSSMCRPVQLTRFVSYSSGANCISSCSAKHD